MKLISSRSSLCKKTQDTLFLSHLDDLVATFNSLCSMLLLVFFVLFIDIALYGSAEPCEERLKSFMINMII